jgi:hypothetical protein
MDIAYKEGSGYQNVPAGEGAFTIEDNATSQALVHEFFTVEKHTPYSLIVLGFAANMEALLFEDDDTPPDSGNARVRFLHGSPTQPAVDIYITEPYVPLEYAVPILENLEFKDLSPFLEMSEGEYQIRMTLFGEREPIFDSGTVRLEEDSIFTAVVVDATAGVSSIGLVLLTDDSEEPILQLADARCMLRLIHVSPDAPFVNLFLDDMDTISMLPFRGVSHYQMVHSGLREVRVEESAGLTLIDETRTLEGGKNYTFLLMNFEAAIEAILLEDDTTRPSPNKAKVRFIHASPDAPHVDFLVGGMIKLSNVPFKGISGYMEFWQGDQDFEVNETETGMVLIGGPFSTSKYYLEEGRAYTFLLVDELEDIRSLLVTDN